MPESHTTEFYIIAMSLVLFAGFAAQWISWRFHLPSILVLMLFGIVEGPLLGIFDVDELMGPYLLPLVSLSIAIILFEGALSLRFREIRQLKKLILSLLGFGTLITWILAAGAAIIFLNFDPKVAFLLGAILTVSGPTVIVPLLREVRPKTPLGPILRWEGILIDPIGAVLAVLIFEFISGSVSGEGLMIATGLVRTFAFGSLIASVFAFCIVSALRHYWVPDYLHNPFALTMAVMAFVITNFFQQDAGLFTVTVMGIILANVESISMQHIIEFKENLRTMLISSLFIILSARLDFNDFSFIDWNMLWFVITIILIRIIAVFAASIKSELTWRERLFIGLVAPRGIIAAAISSIFALGLMDTNLTGAERLAPVTFAVIVATVAFYGIFSKTFARLLHVAQESPQGVLFAGANRISIGLARELQKNGIKTLIVDNNIEELEEVYAEGLPFHHGNILNSSILEELDLDGIGKLIAVSSSCETNSLAALHFSDIFGRSEVYQLCPGEESNLLHKTHSPRHLRGRLLFQNQCDYYWFKKYLKSGWEIQTVQNCNSSDEQCSKGDCVRFVAIDQNGKTKIFTSDGPPASRNGSKMICLKQTIS